MCAFKLPKVFDNSMTSNKKTDLILRQKRRTFAMVETPLLSYHSPSTWCLPWIFSLQPIHPTNISQHCITSLYSSQEKSFTNTTQVTHRWTLQPLPSFQVPPKQNTDVPTTAPGRLFSISASRECSAVWTRHQRCSTTQTSTRARKLSSKTVYSTSMYQTCFSGLVGS